MGLYLNESPPYHPEMPDPVIASKAQHGYLEGDSPELIGKEVWFHTNRHNIKYKKMVLLEYMVEPKVVVKTNQKELSGIQMIFF